MIEKDRVVEIRKCGDLYYTVWKDGEWVERNVSETINSHFFDPCYFEDGLTLKDIFDVVEPNIDMFNIMIPYEHIKEHIEEAKTACLPTEDYSEKMDLLLSWCIEHDKEFRELSTYIAFDGTPKDEKEEHGKYGLDFLPVSNIINCEIRQNTNFNVWRGLGYSLEISQEPLIKLDCRSFTLLEVIHSIFWELSFYGPPEERDKKGAELKNIGDKLEYEINEKGEIE